MNPLKDVIVHIVMWLVLLSIPSLIFSYFPQSDFDKALSKYPGQTAFVIAGKNSRSGDHTHASRHYVLFPSVFYAPKFVSLAQQDSEQVTISESKGLFFVVLLFFTVGAAYYFRKRWTESNA